MQPWERRLRDLGNLLRNCASTYFDPDLFRMNTNQFLQTSRTVTFLIQKQKERIPDFDAWYGRHVIEPWAKDPIMIWAKDSRNAIEKEGDLELHSSITISLIFSYIEEQDIAIPCDKRDLIGANVARLLHFAKQRMPSHVSDTGVIKIDRRWVANSLPDWELLHALTSVYARVHSCCFNLAIYLKTELDKSIPHGTDFDEGKTDSRKVRYVKLSDLQSRYITNTTHLKDPEFKPPPQIEALFKEPSNVVRPNDLESAVKWFSKIAEATFMYHKNHVPMLMLFDEHWGVIDFLSTVFEDQAEKYIFWRMVADRIAYLNAIGIIWICEAWIRNTKDGQGMPPNKLPIVGEILSVVGMNANGQTSEIVWAIKRIDENENEPTLERMNLDEAGKDFRPNYLIPVRKAFEKIRR